MRSFTNLPSKKYAFLHARPMFLYHLHGPSLLRIETAQELKLEGDRLNFELVSGKGLQNNGNPYSVSLNPSRQCSLPAVESAR